MGSLVGVGMGKSETPKWERANGERPSIFVIAKSRDIDPESNN